METDTWAQSGDWGVVADCVCAPLNGYSVQEDANWVARLSKTFRSCISSYYV